MDSLGLRLRTLRESYELRQEDMAERLSVKQGYLSNVESGNKKPSAKLLNKVVQLFAVNEEWLLHGNGEMLSKPLDKNELPPSKGLSDFKVLKTIMATVKECISARKITIEPAEEAGMVIIFYKFFYESERVFSIDEIKEEVASSFDFALNVNKQIPHK